MLSFLGITTTLEARLAGAAVVLAAIAGILLYTHHAGYEECRAPEVAAVKAQAASDTVIDQGVTSEAKQQNAALTAPGGVAAGPPHHLYVFLRVPGSVQARPAAGATGPGQPPASGNDQGLPPGTEAGPAVDFWPVVQDLALSGVLRGTNGDLLWKRSVEQSQPVSGGK